MNRRKSANQKQDQENIFSKTESDSFNSERLPTSPWLTIFKIRVFSYIKFPVFNIRTLFFCEYYFSRIFQKRESREIKNTWKLLRVR